MLFLCLHTVLHAITDYFNLNRVFVSASHTKHSVILTWLYLHTNKIMSVPFRAGKSYGMEVVWMDSTTDEANLWQMMLQSDGEWVEDVLPLRMLVMAKSMSKWDCLKCVDKCVDTEWEHLDGSTNYTIWDDAAAYICITDDLCMIN